MPPICHLGTISVGFRLVFRPLDYIVKYTWTLKKLMLYILKLVEVKLLCEHFIVRLGVGLWYNTYMVGRARCWSWYCLKLTCGPNIHKGKENALKLLQLAAAF